MVAARDFVTTRPRLVPVAALAAGFHSDPAHAAGGGVKSALATTAFQPGAVAPVARTTFIPENVPAFITPASLITVSGGTGAVTLLWQVSKMLLGGLAASPWLAFGFSLLIGAVIYILSLKDQNMQRSLRERVASGVIAFLNSMVLFSAAVGILGRS